MKSTRIQIIAALGAVAVLPSSVLAAGFQVSEHNAAATARAGAVIATVSDPSAIFFNPAGIVHVKDMAVQVGVTTIFPSGTYVGPGLPSTRPDGASGDVTQAQDATPVPVPNVYIARALSEKAHVGFGFYLPYGLSIGWNEPEKFVGRTILHDQSLRTYFLTPTIALRLSDHVAVALSVSLVPATVALKKTLGASDNGEVLFPASVYGSEGTVALSASAFGVGANAGLQVSLLDDHLRLGFSARSAVGLDFSGDADFEVPDSLPASVRAQFEDGKIRGELTLPNSFAFGVGWVQGGFTIEASTNLTLWSAYDELRIDFLSGKPAPSSVSPRDWEFAPTFRLGTEYVLDDLGTLVRSVALRAGVAYDVNPIPDSTLDPTLPDANRVIGSAGVGLDFAPVSLDLGYMAVILPEREVTSEVNAFPGKYESRVIHLAAATVGYQF